MLIGGTAWVALTAAGFVGEILYRATPIRFQDAAVDEDLALLTLTMSGWFYHFCQIAAAVMIIGVSLIGMRGTVFPKWFAYVSLLFVVMALLHTWLPLPSALAGLGWILLTSLVLLFGARRSEDVVGPVPG